MGDCQTWCEIEDLCCDKTKYSPAQLERAIQGASEDLSRWTYHQFGICTYQIQPCTEGCEKPCWDQFCEGFTITPQIVAGNPIQTVEKIVSYDSNKVATELDIDDVWWEYNVLHFPKDFPFPKQSPGPIGGRNTWHIELTAGNPIPVSGIDAAIVLAQKKLEDVCGGDDCKPDPRMKTIVRQGAEWTFEAKEQEYKGIPAVAHFLGLYGQERSWSGVVSPQNHNSQLVE